MAACGAPHHGESCEISFKPPRQSLAPSPSSGQSKPPTTHCLLLRGTRQRTREAPTPTTPQVLCQGRSLGPFPLPQQKSSIPTLTRKDAACPHRKFLNFAHPPATQRLSPAAHPHGECPTPSEKPMCHLELVTKATIPASLPGPLSLPATATFGRGCERGGESGPGGEGAVSVRQPEILSSNIF